MNTLYWTRPGGGIWKMEEKTVYMFTNLEDHNERGLFKSIPEAKSAGMLPIEMPKVAKARAASPEKQKAEFSVFPY